MRGWFASLPLAPKEEENGLVLPKVTPEDLRAIAKSLKEAKKTLEAIPASEIAIRLSEVAQQWLRSDCPERQQALALLPQRLPFSPQACERAFDALMSDLTAERLIRLLDDLLGDHRALDTFVERIRGIRRRAFGADLALLILAGNIVGIGLWDILFCLLCKTPVLVKPSSEDPVLPTLFAQSIARLNPELANAIAVVPFPSEQRELLTTVLSESDVVIAYGTDETMQAIKRLVPAKVRVIERGFRFSIGIVSVNFANELVAGRLALDIARFDQRGCLSPQICFVVGQGAESRGQKFAQMVADALTHLQEELPPNFHEGERASMVQFRLTCEMLGANVLTAPDHSWVIAFWDASKDVGVRAWQQVSCLGRVLHLVAMPSEDALATALRPFGKFLQGVAVAGDEATVSRWVEMLGELGANRICPVGQLQTPPLEWSQDGKHLIAELVRWCDWEPALLPLSVGGWVEIFRGDEPQGQYLRWLLEQQGIPISVESDFDPTDPVRPQMRLRVPAEWLSEAQKILAEIQRPL